MSAAARRRRRHRGAAAASPSRLGLPAPAPSRASVKRDLGAPRRRRRSTSASALRWLARPSAARAAHGHVLPNLPKPILSDAVLGVLSAFMLSFCAITKLMTTDRLAPGIVAVYIFIFAVAIFLELHIPRLGRGLRPIWGFVFGDGPLLVFDTGGDPRSVGPQTWGIFTVILVVYTAA